MVAAVAVLGFLEQENAAKSKTAAGNGGVKGLLSPKHDIYKKKFGAIPTKILTIEGAEVEDLDVVRDDDQLFYQSLKNYICLPVSRNSPPQSFSALPRTPPSLYSPSTSQGAFDPSHLHTPLTNFARAPEPFPCFPAAIVETPTPPHASSCTPLPDLPPGRYAVSPCSRCICLPSAPESSFRVAPCAAVCTFPLRLLAKGRLASSSRSFRHLHGKKAFLHLPYPIPSSSSSI
ncbi:hypothetical protein IEQ34_011334 [Dendrobium chrysotoxum]|uniref:KHA domain-containing protein n=1 Tax=Dendrobium chrysotoxum TaxID=161865 RepID=A0AAV7GX83_DENCH|nr:hypothetical protein IEQ34_011334 [Dendrobium chrysotoxum]